MSDEYTPNRENGCFTRTVSLRQISLTATAHALTINHSRTTVGGAAAEPTSSPSADRLVRVKYSARTAAGFAAAGFAAGAIEHIFDLLDLNGPPAFSMLMNTQQ